MTRFRVSLDIIEHAYLVFVPNVTRPSSFMAVCFSPFDHFNTFSSRIDVTKTQTYGWEMEWGAVGSQETFPGFLFENCEYRLVETFRQFCSVSQASFTITLPDLSLFGLGGRLWSFSTFLLILNSTSFTTMFRH